MTRSPNRLPDHRTPVQRAYDAAVVRETGAPSHALMDRLAPDGDMSTPTDVLAIVAQLFADPAVDDLDAMLAMFATGVLWADSNPPAQERQP